MLKTTIIDMKDNLSNRKVLIIFFFTAVLFSYWLFIYRIEIEIHPTFNNKEAIVNSKEKFSEKFYKRIKNIKIYNNDSLVQSVNLNGIQYTSDKCRLLLDKNVEDIIYDRVTVETNVFSIF